jgi:hypothetical protein
MNKQLTIEHFIIGGNIAAAKAVLDAADVYNEVTSNDVLRFDGTRSKPASRAVNASCGGVLCSLQYKSCQYGKTVREFDSSRNFVKL